jgi:hypothetical protein
MSREWEHSPGFPSLHISFRNCDVKEFDDVQYRLRSLSLLPMLTLAFQKPLLANGQRLLDGLAGDPGVYSTRFGNCCFQACSLPLTLLATCSETSTGTIHVSAMSHLAGTKSLRNGRA